MPTLDIDYQSKEAHQADFKTSPDPTGGADPEFAYPLVGVSPADGDYTAGSWVSYNSTTGVVTVQSPTLGNSRTGDDADVDLEAGNTYRAFCRWGDQPALEYAHIKTRT